MIQAAKRLDDATRFPDDKECILAAVRLNWKLWTIIQADVLDDESDLALEIRQNLLTLSNFIDKHTVSIITVPDATKLGTLVDINKNIAAGLFDSLRGDDALSLGATVSHDKNAPETPEEKISTSA